MVSDYYPNAIVDLPAFRQLVQGDMQSAIREALDEYVIAALIDGSGEDSTDGSSTYEQLRANGPRTPSHLVEPGSRGGASPTPPFSDL
jgi:hypothetical protein